MLFEFPYDYSNPKPRKLDSPKPGGSPRKGANLSGFSRPPEFTRRPRNSFVFINCPFDEDYKPLFDANVFTIYDCGYIARSALEISDSSTPRIDKIVSLIGQCRLSIHDLSRTELDIRTALPRFNMPFELGIWLGAQKLGAPEQKRKRCLILDSERYRFQKFLSDISGQDIQAHGNDPGRAIKAVRNWLADQQHPYAIPGPAAILGRYLQFQRMLPIYSEAARQEVNELTFNDYTRIVAQWLRDHPR